MAFTRAFTDGSPPIGSDGSGIGSTSQATSAGFNLATGKLVVVGVKWEGADGTCNVADTAGNTYTALTKQFNATDVFSVQLFYCLSTAFSNASNIWTATLPTGSTYRNIAAFIYTPGGTASFTAQSGNNTASASNNPNSTAITAGDLGVSVVADFAGTTSTPQSGDSEQYDAGATNGSHGFDRVSSPGGNWTPQCTLGTSTAWGIAGATFTDGVAGPTITSISSSTPGIGDSLTITGTTFGASQGAGSVTIGGDAQTVTAWADTSITITVVRGSNKYGAGVNLVVTDNALTPSAPYGVTALTPPTGWSYVNITTPNTNSAGRLTATPDLANGDQVSYENKATGVSVSADGTFYAVNTVVSFQFEVWSTGSGWGALGLQELEQWAAFSLRRKNGGRTHSKLWRREGWINTRAKPAGWFNKDLILPASGSSHDGSGALSGQAATVSGTATHLTLHTTSGALAGSAAVIAGSAEHQHVATGALAASSSTIAGTSAHLTLHTSSGALVSQSATISGTAAHEHAATGALVAGSATISGAADHTVAGAGHATSGALAADAATVAGTATHLTLHTTTGALAAGAATVAGAAVHPHTTTGALAGQAATIAGIAAHEHAAAGAMAGQAATISGTAVHTAAGTHAATGDLIADAAQISGSATLLQTGVRPFSGGYFDYGTLRERNRRKKEAIEAHQRVIEGMGAVELPIQSPAIRRIEGRISLKSLTKLTNPNTDTTEADAIEAQAAKRARRRRQEEDLLLF
jgi:hypothetical protein